MNLGDLFNRHGSDKESLHGYAEVYEDYFRYGLDTVKNVLEIGVAGGSSLLAWAEYFPKAKILGVDNVCTFHPCDERIGVLFGDQGEPWDLLRKLKVAGREFDLIVDDGSHEPLHQIGCFLALRRLLSPGGVYVIEDVQDPKVWESFPELFPHRGVELVDLRYKKNRYDSLLVVARGPR